MQHASSIVTRFAGITRPMAGAVMLAVLLALAATLFTASQTVPVPVTVVDDPTGGDQALYERIVAELRSGADYYAVTHRQLVESGYGTHSVFNWRMPTLSWLIALFPSIAMAQVMVMVLGVGAAFAMGALLRRLGGWWLAGPGAALMTLSLAAAFTPGSVLFNEVPAGILVLLSAALYGLGHRRGGIAAGFAALLVRELAGLYVLVCIYLAWRNRRWGELIAWGVLLLGYAAFFLWHYWQVQQHILPSDPAYADGWLQFGGLGFLLATASFNGFFLVMPDWMTALVLPLSVLGLLSWPGRTGAHATLMIVATLCLFAIVGKPFNVYWGALYTPVMTIGLVWAPFALRDLFLALRANMRASGLP